ncbi:MAG: anaerobic carbon-monoxide dehydrogenase catalytic subunit [Chitinivibrionales bacterium]|nr:anaerobic carbon-monoxide dehydrogenase catalytic subunit [Chitinivibrionales bacterium]
MEKQQRERSVDAASLAAIELAKSGGMETAWDRHEQQSPRCGFGEQGLCCKVCDMGPCRIGPAGKGKQRGICGANADTIAARQLIRQVAAGAAAHSDHGHDIAKALLHTAEGKTEGYSIKSPEKLYSIAREWGIPTDKKTINEIAVAVARAALDQFSQQEGELKFMAGRPPKATIDNWHKHDLMTRGVEHEIVETLHRTHEGVDADYKNLILFGCKTALGDGWGGAMIATELGDALFGMPEPVRSKVNLGVLKEDEVNIEVHGHEPTLSEMVVFASRDKELLALAHSKGAKGIMVGGICCTAIEILMRQGAPVVGNFLNQELAMATGAVDVMLVDVQCIMPALADHKTRFHTKLITTSKKARIEGAEHIQFDETKALTIAKEIVKRAIENFPNRRTVNIPPQTTELVAGFTVENTFHHLGGTFRSSFRPLNDAIIAGRIRGVAAVIGCNTVKKTQDQSHLAMVKELLRNDVLVVMTGCAATACAKAGLLLPEAAKIFAGGGLQEICETVGIPPVLHLGSCVDNSRILNALCEMNKEGGLGSSLADLPVAAAAPEAMCEKAIAIAFYAVASGCFVNYAPAMRVLGAPTLTKFLTEGIEEYVGGKFCFEEDPIEAAHRMIDHIDKKRAALKLRPLMYAQPYCTDATAVAAKAVKVGEEVLA